jgi:hypothetical protein
MKDSTILTIMALLAVFVVLASSASAACPSCKEVDWSETANAFISGTPMSEDPIPFGPKAARAESSQFEKDSSDAPGAAEVSDNSDLGRIALQSINATPARVNSTGTTRITAVFAINGSEGQDQAEMQLAANAVVRDSVGTEVAKLILIKQSANQYSNDWMADVLPGIYSVDISASSQEGAASFEDALQIEVVGAGASGTATP